MAKEVNPMIRNLLKGFIPTIKDKLPVVNDYITSYLANIELQDGETEAVIFCISDLGVAWIVTAAICENEIKRVVNRVKATDFMAEMITKF